MNKKINLIIGSGVLGAYLSFALLKKGEKVIVTTRSIKKKIQNYHFLQIQNKVKFEKLNISSKKEIKTIINRYKPDKIFYFAGQSSLTKSYKFEKETLTSHYGGTKNFLEIMKEEKLKLKFFKANSGYIFVPKKGYISLSCKFSSNKNPYTVAQQKAFKLIRKYRKLKLNVSNLVLMQVESPLRPKDFFIKKVCLGAKKKKKIVVGNLNTYRDYSWITEVVEGIILTSKLKSKDFMISAGKKLSGREILTEAYKLNKLDYKKYFTINKKYFRKSEYKFLIGSNTNSLKKIIILNLKFLVKI